jgi:hypothetical protein
MRLVILESPYAAETDEGVRENVRYAQRCLRDSVLRGEAPIASHLLYTQILNDLIPRERELGIAAGLAWIDKADAMVVYTDRGISRGVAAAVAHASKTNMPVEYRELEKTNAAG